MKCGAREGLELDHKTYAWLGNERDEDHQYLCRDCHQKKHFRWTREALKARRPLNVRRQRTHSLLSCLLFGYK